MTEEKTKRAKKLAKEIEGEMVKITVGDGTKGEMIFPVLRPPR